jgi:hypothetical protein
VIAFNLYLSRLSLCRVRVRAAGFSDDLGCGSDRLPSRQSLKNARGIFDGINMAVVILDHLNGRAHLFGE